MGLQEATRRLDLCATERRDLDDLREGGCSIWRSVQICSCDGAMGLGFSICCSRRQKQPIWRNWFAAALLFALGLFATARLLRLLRSPLVGDCYSRLAAVNDGSIWAALLLAIAMVAVVLSLLRLTAQLAAIRD
ncbi:hypothetical protein HAX54_038164 [Datura stramonium]|uniref:Uncharacterized protein n=1 Tax=Datura stramonium TaxID=4076 RepID=A0ABS8VJE9_DATST|nr:hypothetical protein [Datura stramonium]